MAKKRVKAGIAKSFYDGESKAISIRVSLRCLAALRAATRLTSASTLTSSLQSAIISYVNRLPGSDLYPQITPKLVQKTLEQELAILKRAGKLKRGRPKKLA